MFFDRKDLLVGVLAVLAAFGTIAYYDGTVTTLIPTDRDIFITDLIIFITCLVCGSALSFCARGKLNLNEP